MNIGIRHCAINADLPTFFDPLVLGIGGQDAIDGFSGFRGYGLDVAIEGGLLEPFVHQTDATEGVVATRIDDMKGQVIITEHLRLLNNRGTQNLISCHALDVGLLFLHPLAKILQYNFTNDRICIENPTDAFKFPGTGMIDLGIHQGHLVVNFFSHFLLVPFFVLEIISQLRLCLLY